MGRMVKQLGVIVGVLALTATPAWAVTLLDFGMVSPTSGSISYDGTAGGTLVGSSIEVDNVVGLGTPANNLTLLTISGGDLDFTTGGFTGSDADEWFFSSGGTITLTGGIDLNGGGIGVGDIPLGSTLLSGTWVGIPTVDQTGSISKIYGGAFVDTKNDLLAQFYGIPTSGIAWDGIINLSFITLAGNTPGNAFTSDLVGSGDIFNFPTVVPEPASASLLLMGLGLLGGIGGSRKKLF